MTSPLELWQPTGDDCCGCVGPCECSCLEVVIAGVNDAGSGCVMCTDINGSRMVAIAGSCTWIGYFCSSESRAAKCGIGTLTAALAEESGEWVLRVTASGESASMSWTKSYGSNQPRCQGFSDTLLQFEATNADCSAESSTVRVSAIVPEECDTGVPCDPPLTRCITTNIFAVGASYFSGGPYPAGNYRVYYINGAMRYHNLPGSIYYPWRIHAHTDPATGNFRLHYDGQLQERAPGDDDPYGTAAACIDANYGEFVEFQTASEGPIGIYFWDDPLPDNVPAPPAPTFCLALEDEF